MTMLFCPASNPDGSDKDSLANAKPVSEGGTGQFVVNLAVEAYRRRVAGAAEPLPRGQSEFALVGLTETPSAVVRPPRVGESPVCFECETTQVIRTNPGAALGGNIVIGRVVHVHARDDVINERMHVDPRVLGAIGRLGGQTYCTTRDLFDLPPGRAALGLDRGSVGRLPNHPKWIQYSW
eukprot:g6002.t1